MKNIQANAEELQLLNKLSKEFGLPLNIKKHFNELTTVKQLQVLHYFIIKMYTKERWPIELDKKPRLIIHMVERLYQLAKKS